MAGPVSLIFSIIVVILIVIGVLDVIKENQDNRCYMTYMFERPEYMVCMHNLYILIIYILLNCLTKLFW